VRCVAALVYFPMRYRPAQKACAKSLMLITILHGPVCRYARAMAVYINNFHSRRWSFSLNSGVDRWGLGGGGGLAPKIEI
jgi:hypothetical protein